MIAIFTSGSASKRSGSLMLGAQQQPQPRPFGVVGGMPRGGADDGAGTNDSALPLAAA